tara:strand:+ start:511 stop:999 length:489 start_codon:yes stop_codon:yes gene_type:complete
MTEQVNKKFLFFLLLIITLALISAFVIEYKLGHQPCKLCLYERIPYFLSFFLLLQMLITKNYQKLILLILSFIFFISSILAFYHLGIEQGFFNESMLCKAENFSNSLSKEELLKLLESNPISCKDVSFTIFGLSLATINTIFSICLSGIFIKMFINYDKNRP